VRFAFVSVGGSQLSTITTHVFFIRNLLSGFPVLSSLALIELCIAFFALRLCDGKRRFFCFSSMLVRAVCSPFPSHALVLFPCSCLSCRLPSRPYHFCRIPPSSCLCECGGDIPSPKRSRGPSPLSFVVFSSFPPEKS